MAYSIATIGDIAGPTDVAPAVSSSPTMVDAPIMIGAVLGGAALGALAMWAAVYRRKGRRR